MDSSVWTFAVSYLEVAFFPPWFIVYTQLIHKDESMKWKVFGLHG